MLRSSELMPGDYVSVCGNPIRVDNNTIFACSQYQALKINEELFLKNKFQKKDNLFIMVLPNENHIEFDYDNNVLYEWKGNNENKELINKISNIHFIHQVQHALKMCGVSCRKFKI